MASPYARRLDGIEPFLAMEVLERAQALEREGAQVLHLEVGEPAFDPPPAAIDATLAALRDGHTNYTDSRGLAELREAIALDKGQRSGVPIDPERVIVTGGTSPAMLGVFSLLVEPGDEVLIPTPHYPCYPNFVRFCGGIPVFVPCDSEDGYRIHADRVRALITDRTRGLIVASPANPTGAVQTPETLDELAGLGVPVVSDEIYGGIVYDGVEARSALVGNPDAYVLDGFSKRYAMTGFRLGYAIVPSRAVRPMQILQQNLFISVNDFVQRAGIAALREGSGTVRDLAAMCRQRRDLLVEGLRKLGFGVPTAPQGAFYLLADARVFDDDSRRLAFRLLETAHVAVTPGVDFGAAAEGWLRFSYAVGEDTLREALGRLGDVLATPG